VSKKNKVAGNPAHDASLPNVSLDLKGETYHLGFDYAALSVAERKLNDAGHRVNLLEAMDLRSIGAERLPIVFFASLLKGQPSMTFEEASSLVTMRTYAAIFEKVVEAYVASMTEAKPADAEDRPTQEPTE
jgi:hypothetical protein